jgi:hypothetical protein
MFNERFAPKVIDGTKRSTIRPFRRVAPFRGLEIVSLRKWEDRPYRSKQIELKQVQLSCPSQIRIVEEFDIWITKFGASFHLCVDRCKELTQVEGFDDHGELITYIEQAYGLPFVGQLLEWWQ